VPRACCHRSTLGLSEPGRDTELLQAAQFFKSEPFREHFPAFYSRDIHSSYFNVLSRRGLSQLHAIVRSRKADARRYHITYDAEKVEL
jgi:hypothetical protein